MIFEVNEKPVSVNKMFKGKKVHTKDYAEYRELATRELWSQKVNTKHVTLTGFLSIKLLFLTSNFKAADLDNMLKCFLDSCTDAGIWSDDRQVIEITAQKLPAKFNKTTITITEIGNI